MTNVTVLAPCLMLVEYNSHAGKMTRTAIVLLIKPFVLWRSRCRRHHTLLKVPINNFIVESCQTPWYYILYYI